MTSWPHSNLHAQMRNAEMSLNSFHTVIYDGAPMFQLKIIYCRAN